jgi:sulfite exporter TauE/SafE
MQLSNLFLILSLALGFGALHAMDTDHLLTLANVSPKKTSIRQTIRFCSRWALGHGAAVIMIGCLVLIFQMAIPHTLANVAEHLVGLILVSLGMLVLIQSAKNLIVIKQPGTPHVAHQHAGQASSVHHHRVIGIGFLHGTSGSATLLALLPMTQLHSAWLGMAYLLFFSLGVLLAMLVFGGVLGGLFRTLGQRYLHALSVLRLCIAVVAMVIGGLMLVAQT